MAAILSAPQCVNNSTAVSCWRVLNLHDCKSFEDSKLKDLVDYGSSVHEHNSVVILHCVQHVDQSLIEFISFVNMKNRIIWIIWLLGLI